MLKQALSNIVCYRYLLLLPPPVPSKPTPSSDIGEQVALAIQSKSLSKEDKKKIIAMLLEVE